ncbi:MAG: DUF167 domain-containing protein [Thermoleophilia bacterium]
MRLAVWAAPGARRSEITGVVDGRLRVRVAAAAIGGRANRELCRFLAEMVGVPPSAVALTAGDSGRRKTIRISGVGLETAGRRLGLTKSDA